MLTYSGFDETLCKDFDSRRETFDVFADWLEANGEAERASLIRLHLEFQDRKANGLAVPMLFNLDTGGYIIRDPVALKANQVITKNWSAWFGPLPSRDVGFDWVSGFVRAVEIFKTERAMPSAVELFAPPLLRFVRFVRMVEGDVSFVVDGLSQLPVLDTLVWQTSPTSLASVERASWVDRLKVLSLELNASNAAQVLSSMPQSLARLGARLEVCLDERTMRLSRDGLREKFPLARLRPMLWQNPDTSEYRHGGLFVTDAPRHAPANFRELAPWETTQSSASGEDRSSTAVGSGVSFAVAAPHNFELCGNCAGLQTRLIYREQQSWYSHFETNSPLCQRE